MPGLARRLLPVLPRYARLAWWGLVSPRWGDRETLRVLQGMAIDLRMRVSNDRAGLPGDSGR